MPAYKIIALAAKSTPMMLKSDVKGLEITFMINKHTTITHIDF